MEFFFANFLFYVVKTGVVLVFLLTFTHFVVVPLHKTIWALGFAVWVFLAFMNFSKTNAPRFVLTDEAGRAPMVETGEIKSTRPKIMTDQERLEYNNQLYNQNKN